MPEEIFGPVLHVATFKADELDAVIDAINASGYGLTFGLHTRISSRVKAIADRIHAGNIYVNRNQIGAVVGSQPFGGEGLSGTGPKAGGPHYLPRLRKGARGSRGAGCACCPAQPARATRSTSSRAASVLCLGPTDADRAVQVALAGENAVVSEELTGDFDAVLYFGADASRIRSQLSRREGPIVPLITDRWRLARLYVERQVCIDTTAAGGNASLMTSSQEG